MKSSGRLHHPARAGIHAFQDEVDPDVANYRRKVDVSSSPDIYYYEIHQLSGWQSNQVYWQGFPPSGTTVLQDAETVPKDTPAPTSATRFTMGDWDDTKGTQLAAQVGNDDVVYIYQVTGSNSGGSGYLVVKLVSGKHRLKWYTSAQSAPASLIGSLGDTVTLASQTAVNAAASSGETWWLAEDDEV